MPGTARHHRSIALVTCDKFPALYGEESDLPALLQARGARAEIVSWTNPAVDWLSYSMVLLRTTWDYFERIGEFRAWIDRMEAEGVRLVNSPAMVRWNMDKQYLAELERGGARIVPTHFVAQGAKVALAAVLAERGWARAILKPAISGGAYRTFRVSPDTAAAQQGELELILQSCGALIQPFVDEIQREGEWSLFFFGGSYSHAVLKVPTPGEFRVQPQFGGQFLPREPDAATLADAARVTHSLPHAPLYARIDGVRCASGFCLMEVEAIEPYLFSSSSPGALARFADVVAAAI